MVLMEKKLNFQAVVSLVIGSQIGSGAFLLPASLAALGPVSLLGWFISTAGALLLALVFAQLSLLVPKGGGPHVYIEKAFGSKAAFFTAWTYWLISWISSAAVIIAAIGYLSPLIGRATPFMTLILEMALLTLITAINLRGTRFAGSLEVFLTFLKCAPLIIIPAVAFFYLKPEYFEPFESVDSNLLTCLNSATLMTFWGFIGLESATTSAGSIENPTKTIPRAVILGTLAVALIYFFNSVAVMGVVPPEVLIKTQAPYVDTTEILFGRGWNQMIALIAFFACIGTLNAWVLTSGQIAAEAAKDRLFPPFFGKINQAGAPYVSLVLSMLLTFPILALTLSPHIIKQLDTIIDVSVATFVLVYLFCCLAYVKILILKPHRSYLQGSVALLASGFCIWILLFISLKTLLLCSLFVLSGIPIYLMRQKTLIKVESE